MPIGLFVLLLKSLTHIKTNNGSPLKPSRTPFRIILIIPGLVVIASKHRNLTAPYDRCIYILNYHVITQSKGTTLLHFIFHMNVQCISYLVQMFSPPGTVMLAVLTSYFISAFSDLYIGSGARHTVYICNSDGKPVSISAIPVIV
jgi:hypothetical protein